MTDEFTENSNVEKIIVKPTTQELFADKDVHKTAEEGLSYPQMLGTWLGIISGDYDQRKEARYVTDPLIAERIRKSVDIVEETQDYVEELLAKGQKPVRIVDFGTAGATTISKVALALEDKIKSGEVEIIGTNLSVKPEPKDFEGIPFKYIVDRLGEEQAQRLKTVVESGLINFVAADAKEFYELFKDKPIHLLFMFWVLSQTEGYNDSLLKAVALTLHPQYGTVVLTSKQGGGDESYDQGVSTLLEAGFKYSSISGSKSQLEGHPFGLVEFQAEQAPKFAMLGQKKVTEINQTQTNVVRLTIGKG